MYVYALCMYEIKINKIKSKIMTMAYIAADLSPALKYWNPPHERIIQRIYLK